MSDFYGQLTYDQAMGIDGVVPICEAGSLLVSQSNFVRKSSLGYDLPPDVLNEFYKENDIYILGANNVRDRLRPDSITHFDATITLAAVGDGWPQTNHAIVRFCFQSIQEPYRAVDGESQPNYVNHYCAVYDWEQQLIIDSYDGEVKHAGPYGQPVSHFIYEAPELAAKPSKLDPRKTYIWVKGDSIWRVAQRLGFEAKELMEHNDIDNPEDIKPGDVLDLPMARDVAPARVIRYEVLAEAMPMHISKKGGTKKWLFGNAKTFEDLTAHGFFPENMNVVVVAVAQVPLVDETGKELTAGYYMDKIALGDYETTGKVKYTLGFSWSDLTAGHVDKLAQNTYEANLDAIRAELAETVAESAANFHEPEPEPEPEDPERNAYKFTYQPNLQQCVLNLPGNIEYIYVRDIDGRHLRGGEISGPHEGQRKYRQHDEILIAGTFEYKGTYYGRPYDDAQDGLWPGIPCIYLNSQAEVYNYEVDKQVRVATGQLRFSERYVTDPLARFINHRQVRRLLQKKTTKE